MFLKPFRVKSNSQLKTSDKKKLRVQMCQQFPRLSEEDIHQLVPLKEDVSAMKLYSNKGDNSMVYLCGGCPLAFTINNHLGCVLLPSVYMCWLYPAASVGTVFHTHPDVLSRLQQGADLMMPGVIISGQLSPTTLGQFEAGSPAVVVSRGAVVAVGTTALSSTDLYMAGGHGKAVIMAHVLGDYLWAAGTKAMPNFAEHIPSAPSSTPVPETPESGTGTADSQDPSGAADLASCSSCTGSDVAQLQERVDELQVVDAHTSASPPPQVSGNPSEAMDDLLLHCFLKAVQQSKGKLPLPLLTSSFYRLHVLPACPDHASLDVKKTSYKKLSKFLRAMEERGILKISEPKKGVENISSVNYNHEDVTSFRYDKYETTPQPAAAEGGGGFVPPALEEVHQVSGNTIEFFKQCGKCKGDILSKQEVREIVTNYVKRKKLADPQTNMVNLEPSLHNAIINPKEGYVRQMKWDQIFSRLLGKMSPAVRIRRPGQADIIKKGKIDCIEMVLAKRAGNKKVTLVYHVSNFGIDEHEFARQLQILAAASTSVGPAEHKPQGTVQVLIQGNATGDVAKLLTDTYNIHPKFIKGMELIPKKK